MPSKAEENVHLFSEALGLAGDVHIHLKYCPSDISLHSDAFTSISEEDQYIEESTSKELPSGYGTLYTAISIISCVP